MKTPQSVTCGDITSLVIGIVVVLIHQTSHKAYESKVFQFSTCLNPNTTGMILLPSISARRDHADYKKGLVSRRQTSR